MRQLGVFEGKHVDLAHQARFAASEVEQVVEFGAAAPHAREEVRLVWHRGEAEGDATEAEADDDAHALTCGVARSVGERRLVADEVEHHVGDGRIAEVVGVHGVVGADLACRGKLVVGDVDRGDVRVREQAQVLQGVLPEAAGTDDGGPGAVPCQ